MPTPDIPGWDDHIRDVWLQWARHPRKTMTLRTCDAYDCVEEHPCTPRREAQRELDNLGVDPYKIMRDFGLTGEKY